jgi:hypothetical protein
MGFLNLFSVRRWLAGRHAKGVAPVVAEALDEPASEPASTFDWEDAMLARCLREADAEAASVWELLVLPRPYPRAIPVLIDVLPRVVDLRIREAVARALTVREARPLAAGVLWSEYRGAPVRNHREQQVKWALGHALGAASDDSVFAAVASLLRERSHGWTRTGLVYAMRHMHAHRKESVALLLDLLEDPDCAADAAIALAKLGEGSSRKRMEPFLQHPDPWVRMEVQRALAGFEGGPREEES